MIALDTNILIHAHRRDASLHASAAEAVKKLAESMRPWSVCYHSLIEFYGVATRSQIWRNASTPEQAFKQIKAWKASPSLRILSDSDVSLETLESLALQANVQGPLIHDARIAACCLANGVTELWTVDRDFSRFSALKTRNPLNS
jgi:toxin-antitoxin system PIN domain toxin